MTEPTHLAAGPVADVVINNGEVTSADPESFGADAYCHVFRTGQDDDPG